MSKPGFQVFLNFQNGAQCFCKKWLPLLKSGFKWHLQFTTISIIETVILGNLDLTFRENEKSFLDACTHTHTHTGTTKNIIN